MASRGKADARSNTKQPKPRKERPSAATGGGDKPGRASKIAGKGATSAKETVSAPSAEAMGAPDAKNGGAA